MRQPMRVVVVGFILLAATSASAQVPQLIRYQGTLVDANNVPLEGSYTLTFRLYDAATAGNILWTETQTGISVSRGVLNVLLGQVTPLTLPFDKPYWLTTQVGTDAEMSPRQRLTSVPYAYRAEAANRSKVAESLDTTPKFEVDTAGTLTNGLVAYWKLDESSGTRTDTKGANTLTDNNTVTQAAGKKVKAGQFASANSEYLSIGDNADLSTGDIDFSIAAWIYLDSFPASGSEFGIVCKSSDVANEAKEYDLNVVGYAGHARAQFQVRKADNSTSTVVASPGEVITATGTWYLLIGWHDATADKIYISVNNATPLSATHTGGLPDSTQSFRIGNKSGTSGNYFNGRIDEVGFWKRVLTAQERADLYNAGAGNTYVNPSDNTQASDPDISAHVYNTSDISLADNTITALTFNSERFDTDAIHDPVTNPSRLTAKTAGKYFIWANVAFAGGTSAGFRQVQLLVNGSTDIAELIEPGANLPTGGNVMVIMTHYQLAANDYVEVRCRQNSGGSLSIQGTSNGPPMNFGMVKLP